MIYPSFKEFQRLQKKANLIPVYQEIWADTETAVSIFKKLGRDTYAFLLESVEGGEKWARYSFIGIDPFVVFRSKGKDVVVERKGKIENFSCAEPLSILKDIMAEFKTVRIEGIPRFFGGAVGYIGYDMVRFFEKIPDIAKDDLNLPDSLFTIMETVVIFDNLKQSIKVVHNAYLPFYKNPEEAYLSSQAKIEAIITSLLEGPLPCIERKEETSGPLEITSNVSEQDFIDSCLSAKEYIAKGDIIQVVLSQRFHGKIGLDSFEIYRALRRINPSPYMFYLKLGELKIIGSSPEVMVRVDDGKIRLRPIAGTRPRGSNQREDLQLKKDLLGDPKERAEHIMLLDLGRNDVGRVAEIGSVKVKEFMKVEKYSHVMHLVSSVEGTLNSSNDIFDVFKATFPAGTVTGAPKIRSMEIIEELEKMKRGPYAGAIGYFSFTGNMDFAILIRTLVYKGNDIYFQVGAGIVADSDPAREYIETVNKGMALKKALELATKDLKL